MSAKSRKSIKSPSKSVHNKAENVKVILRCRPMSKHEIETDCKSIIKIDARLNQIQLLKNNDEFNKTFTFDQIFGTDSTQVEIYNKCAKELVDYVLDGYNGTILAYGQTGTGKTYTMEGTKESAEARGIIPNCFGHIFTHISKATENKRFLVRASFLEIYNEDVRDLLSKNPLLKLEIRESKDIGIYIKGLSSFIVHKPRDLERLMIRGNRNRVVASTEMNDHSSRSHSIFTITLEGCEEGADGSNHVRVGKLNLVDLAGSERQAKAKSVGIQLKEATKINLSLSTLGNVISALVDGKSSHIPYRNSKLTRLLQDSLGGNAKTIMCANIGPADYNYEESLSTLRFANRAKNIMNKARINEDTKDAVLKQLQKEIEELKKKLEDGNDANSEESSLEDEEEITPKSEKLVKEPKKKRYTAEQIEEFKIKISEDRKKLFEQKGLAQEEKDRLTEELRQRETELFQAQADHKQLLSKLKTLEDKIIVGGENLLEKAEIQEKLLEESAKEIQENKIMEQELENKIKQKEKERSQMKHQFSGLHELVKTKDEELAKVSQMLTTTNQELCESRIEQQHQLHDQLESVRHLCKELKKTNTLIDQYIPLEFQKLIDRHVTWNEEIDDWEIKQGCSTESQNYFQDLAEPSKEENAWDKFNLDLSQVYYAYTPKGAEKELRQKFGLSKVKIKSVSKKQKQVTPGLDTILSRYTELRPPNPEKCDCERETLWRPFKPTSNTSCPHLAERCPLLDEYYDHYNFYLSENMVKKNDVFCSLDNKLFYPRTFFFNRPLME